MSLQGSNQQLQGGTGISLAPYNPQRTSSLQVQKSSGIPIQGTNYSPPNYITGAVQQNNQLQSQISNLLSQIKAQQNAYAPPLDLNNIYSQASKKAATAINPYYAKQLNSFMSQQAQAKAVKQKQTQMNIQNLQDQLANTLSGNDITQQRTGQDVLQNEQQIGINADQSQQDQGAQFDQARIEQAKQLASQGLTGAGLGAQQQLQSQTARNTQESRQAADTAQQLQSQELFKTRTFADLARSGELAKQAETKGIKQNKFDLNDYIQNQKTELTNKKQTLESERLSRLSQETQNQSKLLVNKFIQSISNPAQRAAAAQQYGGAF